MALKKDSPQIEVTEEAAGHQTETMTQPETNVEADHSSSASAAVLPEASVAGAGALEDPLDIISLEEVTKRMLRKIDEAVRAERSYIFRHAGASEHPTPYLRGLHSIPLRQAFQIPEIAIAFLSSVSGGKSSFLNVGICKYPIIPAASTETSTCVVEVRRAAREADERIEVCALTDDGAALEKKSLQTFRKQVFNEQLFEAMCDYTNYVIDQDVLSIDDSLAFFCDDSGKICLRRDDWRHCMVMLMVVLDAYVHQDRQADANQRQDFQGANQRRNALLKQLGIPLDRDYGIRLYWSSERIPEHAVLVDLPGTGGTTVSNDEHIGHSDLVSNYLSQAASLICLINETAQMDPETKENLAAFIEANKLKGSSSARVNFVLNKADRIDNELKDERKADRKLRGTIKNFRENFPYSVEYPIYVLSTFDGELSLLDSGIPLGNLHHASSERRDMERRGQEPAKDTLLNIQRTRYERAYPCQMRQDDAFGTQTFPQFINTLVTDYISRIHFLQTMERFREHVQSLTNIADVIHTQQELLRISQDYSPQLASTLVKTIEKSMDETIEELNVVVANLQFNMGNEMIQAAKRMDTIAKQFTTDYQALSRTINGKIKTKVNSLASQKNGKIPIGANIGGGNETGIKNEKILRSLGDDMATINFMASFKQSFQTLQQEFDRQRRLFRDSLDTLCRELDAFPDKTVNTMRGTFQDELDKQGLGDVQAYQAAMKAVEETARKLLRTVCAQYVAQLRQDRSVLDTLDDTANRIQRDLLDLLSTYTDKNFGLRVIWRIQETHFFVANTLDHDNLKQFLAQTYITDFERKMKAMLDLNISGRQSDGRGNANDSHVVRMTASINKFYKKNLSVEALGRLNTQVQNACVLVDGYIGDPRYFEDWERALSLAAKDLQQFFSEHGGDYFTEEDGAACVSILSMAENFADAGWAKVPVQMAKEEAEAARSAAAAVSDAAMQDKLRT